VEKEWDRFTTGFIKAAEEVCGQKMEGEGTRKHSMGRQNKRSGKKK
jgi:hypothetical protein